MNKERLRKKYDTPRPYLSKAHRSSKEPFQGERQSYFFRGKIVFWKKEESKDDIPADVATLNSFESSDEEVHSSWVDILSDSFPSSCEEEKSNSETIDLISLPGTEKAEHSSPEIMRFEENKFSEEIVSPLEYQRNVIDLVESYSNFSPKLTSTQIEYSRIFDRSVHQPAKLEISLKNIDVTVNAPDICNFVEHKKADSLENENSLPSTITAPDIFNFEEVEQSKDALVIETTPTGFENVLHFFRKGVKNSETSFITTINTEDVVDDVFKHRDEPSGPNFNDALITTEGSIKQHEQEIRRSLNGTLISTPETRKTNTRRFFLSDSSNLWFSRSRLTKGNKACSTWLKNLKKVGGVKKISPRQLFIHSKLSSGELNTSIIRQSSGKNKGKLKKRSIPIPPQNPPKATNISGTNKQGYRHSNVASNLKSRKKTPNVTSKRSNKKKNLPDLL